jgi:drug/metabolite transporter (DMT)-like permease
LLAYIELVYAFAADILLFDSTFTLMELVGAAIITFFNVLTIVERGRVEEERRSQLPRLAYKE